MSKSARNKWVIEIVLFVGIALRFFMMTFGDNFDFESYCIVGDIVSSGKNVYANTIRYNYGPIFSIIQGLCYKISMISLQPLVSYRVLIVSVLTLADVGIMIWLREKYSTSAAVLFFLNPVSIYISGYHNQFDNIAVLFMLLASLYYNDDEKIGKKDIYFTIFMSLSLIFKHIFFIFPFWLLVSDRLNIRKRCFYAFVPPIIFLLSFAPYMIGNSNGMAGILQNVFLYRSTNNFPLLSGILETLHVSGQCYVLIFGFLMCLLGFCIRKEKIEYRVLLYSIGLLVCSSAIADQYIVIPLCALFAFSKSIKYLYVIFLSYFVLCKTPLNISFELPFSQWMGENQNVYFVVCLLLLIELIIQLFIKKRVKSK